MRKSVFAFVLVLIALSAHAQVTTRNSQGLAYGPPNLTVSPWENRPAVTYSDAWGRYMMTVGLPNTAINPLYNCATPLTIPAQPLDQDSAFNICGTYTNATGVFRYSNQFTSTAYVTTNNLDVNAIVGTTISHTDHAGGSGIVGVGKAHTANAIAYGSEIAAVCHAPGQDCAGSVALQLETGGGNGGGAAYAYLKMISGAAANSPLWGIQIDSDAIGVNPFQPSSTIFGLKGSLISVAYGIDFRLATIGTYAFASPGFSVDGSGNITAANCCGGDSSKSMMAANTASAVNSGQTVYFSTGGLSGGAVQAEIPVPFAFTARNFYGRGHGPAGAGQSYVYALLKNGAATGVTCTVSGASQGQCSDVTNSVVFAAGDRYQVRLITSGASATVVHAASFEVNP